MQDAALERKIGMRVLISGGGTAGHINPALAIAQEFRANDPDGAILFVGTPNGMEADLIKRAGFDFQGIPVMGFYRSFSPSSMLHNARAVYEAQAAKLRAKRLLKEFKPDIVIGTGGYVCGPVVLQAEKMGIRTALHEQNAFPGMTIRMLAPKADYLFLAVEEAKEHLPQGCKHISVVGNPVRAQILKADRKKAREKLGIPEGQFTILSFGGSLGADTINKMAADLIAWHKDLGNIRHIHGYGRLGKEKFPALMREQGTDLSRYPLITASEYIYNIQDAIAACDLIICRCGALSLAELEVLGKPSILVPSPNVTANHQYYNGMVLVNRGAAVMIEEKDYDKARFLEIVRDFAEHPEKCAAYGENARKLAVTDTASRIYHTLVDQAAE